MRQCEWHVFDLGDDATCDICGIPKSEVVDIEEYRAEWRDRLMDTETTDD